MNDYKELIYKLRITGMTEGHCEILLNAADAIEQLVNDYEIIAKMYAKVNEDLCVRTKERDAAINDISESCPTCNHKNCHAVHGCEWEWRGVQNEVSE